MMLPGLFGCTRSLQLSRVAFGLPRLQLEAGPYCLTGSYHFAWAPSSSVGDAVGCPDQSWGSQLSRGPTHRLSHFSPSHTGRSAGAMAEIPPGGRSSRGSTRWSIGELQLAGSPASPRFYVVAAHLHQAILLSRYTGRSVVLWPRLLRAVGAAAGRSRPPGIVQLRPSSSRGSPRWRSLRVAGPQ